MFSGIVQALGVIRSIHTVGTARECTIHIGSSKGLAVGDSISISGICSTIVKINKTAIEVFFMPETCAKTTVSSWHAGMRVNIERSLRVGDPLSGHMVFGHIDGVAEITRRSAAKGQTTLTIKIPAPFADFLIRKGSITCDGVGLTIIEIRGRNITVALTPYTSEQTTLGDKKIGDFLNCEIDMIAKMIHNLRKR